MEPKCLHSYIEATCKTFLSIHLEAMPVLFTEMKNAMITVFKRRQR